MTEPRPIVTIARADAYLASALGLLMRLFDAILRLACSDAGMRRQELLSRAERAVEGVLFLKAMALHGPLPARRMGPSWAPRGFRRKHRNSAGVFFKSVRIRARKAGALARVIALIAALTQPKRAIAYFLKQICKGLRGRGLVAVRPPAVSLAGGASIAPAYPCCDSS